MKYGLVKSFNIDNGELAEKAPSDCFVLGYELALIDSCLKGSGGFERPIHSDNCDRIIKSCQDAKRKYHLNWMEQDMSETWMWLKVEAK